MIIGSYFDRNLATYNNAELTSIAFKLYWQTCISTKDADQPTYAARMLHSGYGIPIETAQAELSRVFQVIDRYNRHSEVQNRIVALLVDQQRFLLSADR